MIKTTHIIHIHPFLGVLACLPEAGINFIIPINKLPAMPLKQVKISELKR
jgi:hypothetical protein